VEDAGGAVEEAAAVVAAASSVWRQRLLFERITVT